MFDLMDIFAFAISVGIVTGGFFLITGAFARLGWKYWHIVLVGGLFLYWFV